MKLTKNGTKLRSNSKYFLTDPATFLFEFVLRRIRDWRLNEMDMMFMIMIRLS
jgi:hypothetical protein